MSTGRDDMTVGELDRRLDDLRGFIKDGFSAVNKRFDDMNVVHSDTYEAHREASNIVISTLKDELAAQREEIKEIKKREWGNVKMAMGAFGVMATSVLGALGATKGIG